MIKQWYVVLKLYTNGRKQNYHDDANIKKADRSTNTDDVFVVVEKEHTQHRQHLKQAWSPKYIQEMMLISTHFLLFFLPQNQHKHQLRIYKLSPISTN